MGSIFTHNGFQPLQRETATCPQLSQEIEKMQWPFSTSGAYIPSYGHQEIDQAFSTDYSCFFEGTNNQDITALTYQMQGERAYKCGHYDQAMSYLGKAIEKDPTNPYPYLERSAAHFSLGQYDRSLEDYHKYSSQIPKSNLSFPDFGLGFAKGLPQGIYESGKGILIFLSDLITQPIHTGEKVWEALTTLADLAHTDQWETIAETLSPEIHQLITKWDTLTSGEKGELAGYAFGKHGSDIVIPGALAKAISKGVKGTKELSTIYRNLKTAEKTLILESASGLESGAKVKEIVQTGRKTALLAEELGFTTREVGALKQTGSLEKTLTHTYEDVMKNPTLRASFERSKKAKEFLKSHRKKYMPEAEVRAYIHKTGTKTFPRPKGIPENYKVKISDKGAGMEYVHPTNEQLRVRVMPGKPHSPYPYQQKPYVVQMKNGKAFDKYGNIVKKDFSEAHIPLEEYIYRN